MIQIIAEILGIIGILFSILTFQCRRYKLLMGFRITHEMSFALQYMVLGAFDGMAMNLLGVVRNLVFNHRVAKNKSTTLYQVLFSMLTVIIGLITFKGLFSILIIFAKVLSTIAYGFKNLVLLKIMVLISTFCWIIYNVTIGSVTGVINDGLTVVSIVLSLITTIILLRKQKRGDIVLDANLAKA